jgi:pyruvate dehydrogenase E2 component (dihydrolipoyllysine-residue acetyltransferase)
MPALDMAQETGKLLAWRKKEGDSISQGEPLLDIETDKAVVEIESPASGILAGVRAREGDVVPVGQTIAWIILPGENLPVETHSPGMITGMQTTNSQPSPPAVAKASGEPAPSGIKISPKARRLAREHGINPTLVRGSGKEGEILADDILALVASPPAATNTASLGAPETMSAVARLMAERTTWSWTSVPHFFVVREIDAGRLVEAHEKFVPASEREEGVRVTYTDFLAFLAARVLRKHPRVNASWADGGIQHHPEVNIGIAIAVDEGVVTVVIPSADTRQLGVIAALRLEMTERARTRRSRPADLRGATFTISNLGMYNVDAFTAIIPAQQAAILAVGRIVDRVVPVNGKPGIRPMMTVTLSCDHRVVDGAPAAKFLNDFVEAASQPEKWLAR